MTLEDGNPGKLPLSLILYFSTDGTGALWVSQASNNCSLSLPCSPPHVFPCPISTCGFCLLVSCGLPSLYPLLLYQWLYLIIPPRDRNSLPSKLSGLLFASTGCLQSDLPTTLTWIRSPGGPLCPPLRASQPFPH